MKFHKNVPKENREYLKELLANYEKETAMSCSERQELYEWVAKGRSPYENGDYVCGGNGDPLDFITALRDVKEQLEWFQSLNEEEQRELLPRSEPQKDGLLKDDIDNIEELPFR